ncbi:phage major capsid protein [Sporichthya sp.]|uniref:phage major capsid protein n=1 Tax=Sporichthya sp. TaxID=65475 RepID=UPI0017B57D1E|nr:phage major capsid protein [Sporichthya sp.]MBA3742497.1 phage major capsid protein [Sporichthya sp.]
MHTTSTAGAAGTDTSEPMVGWLQRSVDSAREIITRAETEDRELTEAEATEHAELLTRAESLHDQVRRSRDLRAGLERFPGLLSGAGTSGTQTRGEYDSDARLGAAPALFLTRDQMSVLHEGFMTRAVTSATAPQVAVSDYLTMPAGTFPILRDAFRVLDLIPVEATAAASVTYYRGNAAASNAKVVGEGGQKPLSDPSYTAVTEGVRKVAHYIDVSEEAITDLSSFRDMVESEALMGLLNEENSQLVSGNGAAVAGTGGVAMTGLLNTSGILTYAPVAAEARIVSVAKAQTLLQAGSSFTNPDTVLINPSDFEKVRLYTSTANEFAAGFALGGDAQSMTVWGMRAYVTNRITAGTALVGNLAQAARVYVRMAPTVKVDPFSRSTENIIRLVVEERLALTVPRPSALLKVTFNGTT